MRNLITLRWVAVTGVVFAALTFVIAPALHAAAPPHGAHEKILFAHGATGAEGSELTAVLVTYAPGGKSPRHHHAGAVFAYVVAGEIRSENSATGPARVYKAGDAFFEPVGSTHLISENASATSPATLLAIFVAQPGVQLTAMDP